MATLRIPIPKGGGYLEVNTDGPEEGGDIPQAVFEAALVEGLKVLLTKGMSKILTKGLEGAALQAAKDAAMVKANENLDKLRRGELGRAKSVKDGKTPAKVHTEAMRIARGMVKEALKRHKVKVSYIPASEITKSAKVLLADNPSILEKAAAAIAEQEAMDINIELPKVDPKLAAKAEAAKAKASATLSAAQAGKPKVRKGKGQQATA